MKYSEFAKGWALGNCNEMDGIVSLNLGRLKPDVLSNIQKEIDSLVSESSSSEVARADHITNWTKPMGSANQYSLFNKSNNFDDFSSDHDGQSVGKSTSHLRDYPELKKLIDSFPGKLNCRLNRMGAGGGGLSPHEEHVFLNTRWLNISNEMRVRIHIVLVTNDQAKMYLRKERYHYEEGKLYAFNNGAVHSAINNGPTDRYHIVMDCRLDEELYKFFEYGTSQWEPSMSVSSPEGEFEWDVFQSYGGVDSLLKKIGIKSDYTLTKFYVFMNKMRALIIRSGFLKI